MGQIQMLEGLFGNADAVAGGSRIVQDDSSRLVSGYLGGNENEKSWPKINGSTVAPTNNRAARFQENLEKDVARNHRYTPQSIKNKRGKLGVEAKQHAKMAGNHAVAAKNEKKRIDNLKKDIKNTPPTSKSNVARRAEDMKKILDAEVRGRAHAALFAQHAAASQKAIIAESILSKAQTEPDPNVRVKVVAAAEAVEKTPERGEVEKVAFVQVDSKVNAPNGVPTVRNLVRNSAFARQIVSRGGIPGLYDFVAEHNQILTVGSFIHGLGQPVYDNQLDRWGRPLPGPTPRDEAMVKWIMNNAQLGGFTGGFGGFDGWWTAYKKRAKKRWEERLARMKKRLGKKSKGAAGDIASKAAELATKKAAELAQQGLEKGLSKIGSDPSKVSGDSGNVDMGPVVDTSISGRRSAIGDMIGVSLPGWVDFVGAAVGIAGGALIVRKVTRRRKAGF